MRETVIMAMIPSKLSPQGRCDSRTHVWDLIEYNFVLIIANVQKTILILPIQNINSVAVFLKLCKNFTLLIGDRAGYKCLELFVFLDVKHTILLFKRKIFSTINVWVLNFEHVGVLNAELQNEHLGRIVFSYQSSLRKFPELQEFVRKNIPFYFKVSHILISLLSGSNHRFTPSPKCDLTQRICCVQLYLFSDLFCCIITQNANN